MSDRQPVADQGAQAGPHLAVAPVEVTHPDCRGQVVLAGVTQRGQGVARRGG